MICQNCLKNQSNYHFTKIINGNKTEYHLCESCAREKGDIIQGPGNSFSIHNLLSGMLNIEFGPTATQVKANDSRCTHCGMTFKEFSKKGRFGCAQCYQAFGSQLDPIIRRVQLQNASHSGKTVNKKTSSEEKAPSFADEIKQLENELQLEISNEHYERAAILRDRISSLRKRAGIDADPLKKSDFIVKKWPHFDEGEGV